ncbi:hypothetical protein EVAR_101144_1 [Eumeta japonica]|uniref:Uncharacterized protein n=1 Tax=Eumeta variegata TaxID=151549 RepID=A0A4C2A660_EUMVA|nr:hypothetical protein EVAR_101144_1 [Eumeta japonica]
MSTAAHRLSQPQTSHQCVFGPLGVNKIANGWRHGLRMEKRGVKKKGGHQISHSLDETQQPKLLLYVGILFLLTGRGGWQNLMRYPRNHLHGECPTCTDILMPPAHDSSILHLAYLYFLSRISGVLI